MIFAEKQSIMKAYPIPMWTFVILMAAIGWAGFVWQIILNRPFGTNPGPNWSIWVTWVSSSILFPIFMLSLKLSISVDKSLRFRFTPIHIKEKVINPSEIESVSPVIYSPIKDYWGWGIRYNPLKGWAYSVSGNEGVLIKLKNGKSILIGSQKKEELSEAIKNIMSKTEE